MARTLTAIFVLSVVFWIWLTIAHNDTAGLYMQILLFLVPFLGAISGFMNAKEWGISSAVGKGVALISAGVLAWAIGMLIWVYYIFIAQIEIPYPSLADGAFIISWPLWAIGVFYLSKATGVSFALREAKGKVMLFVTPIIAIAISYYLLIHVARGGVVAFDTSSGLKIFFDLFYPIGSAVIFALVLTFVSLSTGFLGGKFRTPIIILMAGFVVNFISDITFSYTTTNGSYFNGHFVDLLFMIAMYLLSLSLVLLSPKLSSKNFLNVTESVEVK
jgi:hypothetical protein